MTFKLDFPGHLCRAAFAILAMFLVLECESHSFLCGYFHNGVHNDCLKQHYSVFHALRQFYNLCQRREVLSFCQMSHNSLFVNFNFRFIIPHLIVFIQYKVNRCLARYSPRTTTTNQQGKHILGQKWPFLKQTSSCHFQLHCFMSQTDLKFVKYFTQPDFWAKNFTQ